MSLIQCASYLRKGIPMVKISYSRRVETIRCFKELLERPIPAGSKTPLYVVAIGSNNRSASRGIWCDFPRKRTPSRTVGMSEKCTNGSHLREPTSGIQPGGSGEIEWFEAT
jgi:hypothetical protein